MVCKGVYTLFHFLFLRFRKYGTVSAVFFCYFRVALKLVRISAIWTFDLTGFFLCFFFFYFLAQHYLLFCLLLLAFTILSVIMLTWFLLFFCCSNLSIFVGYRLRIVVQGFSFSLLVSYISSFFAYRFFFFVPLPFSAL